MSSVMCSLAWLSRPLTAFIGTPASRATVAQPRRGGWSPVASGREDAVIEALGPLELSPEALRVQAVAIGSGEDEVRTW